MDEAHKLSRADQVVFALGLLTTFAISVSGETPNIFNDILQFYGENGSVTPADINNLFEHLNKKPPNLEGILSSSQVG